MKKIFFLIAVLFSFTGYAQTVGQLRYDTVKMYKVGGTTELILQNASSGVVGGVLRNVINGRTVFQTVVDTVFKNATADSFVYYIGGVRRAFKDSSGSGTYARDTIVAGRGLTGTTINANKVQLDNDSAVYIVTQINDTTLSFTHYDGSIDTVTIVSSGGGGGSGWSLTGNAGTNPATDFIGTTDDVGLRFRTNNTNSGQINRTNFSTGFGVETLNSNTGSFNNAFGWNAGFSNTTGSENNSFGHASQYKTTTGINNNAFGYSSLYENIAGSENNAFGYRALGQSVSGTMNTAMGDSSLITLTTGSRNTAIGANADVATSSTDSAVAIGFEASAATKQVAFSPHLTTMFLNLDSATGTAPAIAGIDENGNWRKYATPSGGSSQWTDTTAGIYYADKVGIGVVSNPTHTLTLGDSSTSATYFQSVDESDDVFSIYSPADGGDIVHIDNNTKNILLGEIGNYKVAIGIATPDSTLTVNGGTHLMGGVRASGLATSGTYSKSLAIDASGNVYTKDTAALTVSNLGGLGTGVATLLAATPSGTTSLAGTASPTFTGVITAAVISATGVVATTSTLRSGISSPIEHAASNKFTASSNGFENLTSSAGTANTANLSVGSLRTGYVAKTANYTATAFDETISCSTNAFTVTLPTAVGCAGQKYNITNSTAANTITIGTTSSQTFANVTATPTTLSLAGLGAVIVVSDGANWLQLK